MKRNIIFGCIFLVGFGVFLYPTVSNWLATRAHYSAVSSFDTKIKAMEKQEIELRAKEADEYNKKVQNSTQPLTDPFNGQKNRNSNSYADALNIGDVMGYIEIPKIDVKLPIYQGTSEEVLSRGVGHVDESSLPIGGEGTHTVLTGHRGLPSAVLFSNLDKLEKSDVFYIHSLDKTLAYRVDQIKVVLPNETNDLLVVKDQDYATLITCTPYGVNTHRLLVRGHRIPLNAQEKEKESASKSFFPEELMIWMIIVPIAILVVLIIYMKIRKKSLPVR
ncbi:class C sortase [Ectobacillus polymachus]|uniref:class C sortase n=1 Tax=Ectobacillus polymachus TaxID=1508806 RepID=UPI003A841085